MNLLSFLVFFALYAGAAFPSFGTREAAELLAAAAAGGVPSPPAQTLTWLIAKVSLWIPFGGPGYRGGLAAAALMAGTVPLAAGFLSFLSPAKSWSPTPDRELEQERWRTTACWLTAFLWGLSPGPWACALTLGPDTAGLFLTVLAFRVAAAPPSSRFPWGTFLAALAVGQWPPAAAALPGLLLIRPGSAAPVPLFSRPWWGRVSVHAAAAALGLCPALLTMPISRAAPPLDALAPARWESWLRHAVGREPFFPPARADGEAWKAVLLSLGSLYAWPGAALWLYGLWRTARAKFSLFQAALLTAALPGPALFLWARPAPDLSQPAQAAAWGLCALGLSIPLLWGYHRAGVKAPAARAALALLLPLSLMGRLPSAARTDASLRDHAENQLMSLPPGALLWDPASPGPLFYTRFVEGRRKDLRIARHPETSWGRAEYRRRHPGGDRNPAALSPEAFFLDAAAEPGPDKIFVAQGDRLPAVDPATGLLAAGRFPDDAFPAGVVQQSFPSASRRLVAPEAQLSVARVPLWGFRRGDAEGLAEARMALSAKYDQYGLSRAAAEEALAALTWDPDNPEAHRRLGEEALAQGNAPRAVHHFKRALAGGGRADLWALASRAEKAAGNRPRSVRAARAALALDPALDDTALLLAETLEEEGRWDDAAGAWKTLMDRHPELPAYPWRLAKARFAAGRPAEAKAALREYLMFPLSPEEKDEAEAFEKSLEARR